MKRRLLLLLSVLLAAPTTAQQAASPPTAHKPQSNADERKICEEEEQIGSRLNVRRVCATRSEWQRRRLEDRQTIEKNQVQFGLVPPG